MHYKTKEGNPLCVNYKKDHAALVVRLQFLLSFSNTEFIIGQFKNALNELFSDHIPISFEKPVIQTTPDPFEMLPGYL